MLYFIIYMFCPTTLISEFEEITGGHRFLAGQKLFLVSLGLWSIDIIILLSHKLNMTMFKYLGILCWVNVCIC
jgi:hypothetical protein